jgi:hypothetical protein
MPDIQVNYTGTEYQLLVDSFAVATFASAPAAYAAAERLRYISRVRGALSTFLFSMRELLMLQQEYNSLGYSAMTEADALGVPFTIAEFKSAIASIGTLDTTLSAGHYTNFYRVKG